MMIESALVGTKSRELTAMDHKSPTLGGAPSDEMSAVPKRAVAAEPQVTAGMERRNSTAEKIGTSFEFGFEIKLEIQLNDAVGVC